MTGLTTIASLPRAGGCQSALPESNEKPEHDREIRFLGDMQRLQVKPGDLYVLSCDADVSEEQCRYINDWWERNMPGTKCMVLGSGMKLGVVAAEPPIDPEGWD